MKTPKPTIAYHIPDAKRKRFASQNEMYKKLGIAPTYAARRINTGKPCKGWLLYDANHADSPEAREQLRKHCPEAGYVSVRIDSRTTILVKAEKWTPDYAERYREKLNRQPDHRSGDFRQLQSVKGGGR